jgi:hypothetical protein
MPRPRFWIFFKQIKLRVFARASSESNCEARN